MTILKIAGYLLAIYLIGMFVFYVSPQLGDARCNSKWEGAGLKSQYKLWIGCVVLVNGVWVPEANVQFKAK